MVMRSVSPLPVGFGNCPFTRLPAGLPRSAGTGADNKSVSVTGRAAGGGGDVETTGVALAGDAPEEEGIGIDDDGF